MQVQSISFETVASDYVPLAVLDAPFAEALQRCFTLFYAPVGLPNLDPTHYMYLTQEEASADGQSKRT